MTGAELGILSRMFARATALKRSGPVEIPGTVLKLPAANDVCGKALKWEGPNDISEETRTLVTVLILCSFETNVVPQVAAINTSRR